MIIGIQVINSIKYNDFFGTHITLACLLKLYPTVNLPLYHAGVFFEYRFMLKSVCRTPCRIKKNSPRSG